ncbi:hypothetical protein BJX64DRAFT_1631 [Aspergillus heterothallicus]
MCPALATWHWGAFVICKAGKVEHLISGEETPNIYVEWQTDQSNKKGSASKIGRRVFQLFRRPKTQPCEPSEPSEPNVRL